MNFYLSPPLLSLIKDKRTGRPKKFQVPGYLAIPAFRLLRSLSFLRGTWLDPLSIMPDRKRDKKHKSLFLKRLDQINEMKIGERSKRLNELVNASMNVKGYGPVREQAYKLFENFLINSREKVHKANIDLEANKDLPKIKATKNKDKEEKRNV